jgi:hypothetical protein
MVLTVSFVLSPVTGLGCHRRLADTSAKLDASVGASGPHDFAVRKLALSSEAPLASTASRPAFVTIAKRPSVGTGRRINKTVSTERRNEIFFSAGMDRKSLGSPIDLPDGQISRVD